MAKIITAVVILFLTIFLTPLFEGVRNFLFSNVQIPVLVLIFFLICLLVLTSIVFSRLRSPKYVKYTEDIFDGMKWRWNYDFLGNIKEPSAYCLKDDMLMVYSAWNNQTTWECELCKSRSIYNGSKTLSGDALYNKNRVKRLIDQKIRTNYKK